MAGEGEREGHGGWDENRKKRYNYGKQVMRNNRKEEEGCIREIGRKGIRIVGKEEEVEDMLGGIKTIEK